MKMGRLAWYAGASAVAAGAVVASAFHQRANFYSAMVHLAQSSLSLMILINLVFLVYGTFMYGLQRLCFGQLRPVEIEQLYEKAWFAVTDTCLAMTIFREEVGAFFLVMFTALVTGKVWGWIGEGRVELLEQQPPANPRLFHTRLSISLLLSTAYNIWLLEYAVNTVVQQARPTMMVMFLFEFAVQTISSFHTGFRYIISLVEARVIQQQMTRRLEDRRRQVREQRAEILRRRETEGVAETEGEASEPLPSEDDIDEMDIEVPGWETKGQWVLGLDLVADFIKMGIYTAFFCVLFTFHGLPIHIMRDVFMTTRSFVKRLHALLRYRQALRDMNKYPDATAEELGREDTCIVCREEMHLWDAANPGQLERSRPKKLPCDHILHFGCLKSWLERQQVCPTCRRSVVMDAPPAGRNGNPMFFRFGLNLPAGNDGRQPPANEAGPGGAQAAPGAPGGQNDQQGNRNWRVRVFNLGPVRIGFGQGVDEADMRDMAEQLLMQPNAANPQAAADGQAAPPQDTNSALDEIREQLADINHRVATAGRRVQRDIEQLQNAEAQLQMMNISLQEMTRLNHMGQAIARQQQQAQHPAEQDGAQANPTEAGASSQPSVHVQPPQPPIQIQLPPPGVYYPPPPGMPGYYNLRVPPDQPLNALALPRMEVPTVTRHVGVSPSAAIPAGSPDLPEGVVLPQGWTLLPLQRLDGLQGQAPPGSQVQVVQPATMTAATADLTPRNGSSSASNQSPSVTIANAAPPGVREGPVSAALVDPTEGQEQRGRSRPAAPAPAPQTEAASSATASSQPEVTAPTPVLPNWGGVGRLVGTGGIGARDTAASTRTQERNDEKDREGDGEGVIHEQRRNGGGSGGSNDPNGKPAEDKGKAKAVTVEDEESENDT